MTIVRWAGLIIALVLAIVAPFFVSSFVTSILTTSLVFAIFAVSLNIILGHGGLVSLGHAVFFGVGAYTVGLLVQQNFNHIALCILAGIAVSMVFALVMGPIILRTREIYFLMVTLAIGEVLRNIAISWRSFTSGDDGISGVNAGVIAGVDLSDGRNFYFLALGALVLTLLTTKMLMDAPFGHALRALRDNRSRMSVLGVRPLSVQLTAFVIAAGMAGFAGGLFAYEKAFVSPDLFSVHTSAQALLMVVVGGAGSLFGPVIGAFIIEIIRGIGSIYTDRWQTVLGLLAVLVALVSPKVLMAGIWSTVRPSFWKKPGLAAAPSIVIEQPTALAYQKSKADKPVADGAESAAIQPALRKREFTVMQDEAILRVDSIAKRFGGLSVLTDISMSVAPGERRGLIGPNGAGKTTFLNILSGIEQPTAGRVFYQSDDVTTIPSYGRAQRGIGRTFQIGNLFNDCTVRENIALSLVAREGYSLRFGRSLNHYSDLQREAEGLLERWNLRDVANIPVKLLSYGQRRVVEIVLALATKPKLLLLDEPAAGLSGAETKVIIETIGSLDPDLTILIVEHDMDLIFSVCDRVTVIANGKVLAEGVGDEVRRNQLVIDAYLGMPL